MRKLKNFLIAGMLALGVGAVCLPAPAAFAIDVFKECNNNSDSEVCKASNSDDATSMIEIVINTLLFLLGSIAVVMIVVGGFRYVTSNGEQSNIKSAKETILYSVVGLVVAILSFVIVDFVLTRFGG